MLTLAATLACAQTPKALESRVQALVAADAQDCGTVSWGADRTDARECASRALASGAPFRVAFQLRDTSWQAAVRDARGRVWAVFYETAAAGESGAGPTLSAVLCRALVFEAHGDEDALDCTPTLGAD
jgi:hypothetical protein